MKLLNILGAVVAVHIAVLVLAIAIPGCRTTKTSPTAAPGNTGAIYPAPASSGSPISSAPEMSQADLNPPLSSGVPTTFDPNAPARSTTAVGGSRTSPTRPSSGVGVALQPQAVPDEVRPVQTYTVVRGDSLWSVSKRNGISVRELASANGLAADAGLRLGQVLVVPGKMVSAPAVSRTALAADTPSVTYEIRPGDTLGKIAQRHGTTVARLKVFNGLTSDMVRAGDTLAIPEAETQSSNTVARSTNSTPTQTAPASAAAGTFKHTVQPGESLTVIAQKYGVKIGEIALANKVRDPSLIRPGQELIIPGWQAPPPAPPVTTTLTAAGTTTLTEEDTDLDAGFGDEDLGNVPVITVEEPIKTIGGPNSESPPVFE